MANIAGGPTSAPSMHPSEHPSQFPSVRPTGVPTIARSKQASLRPSLFASAIPSVQRICSWFNQSTPGYAPYQNIKDTTCESCRSSCTADDICLFYTWDGFPSSPIPFFEDACLKNFTTNSTPNSTNTPTKLKIPQPTAKPSKALTPKPTPTPTPPATKAVAQKKTFGCTQSISTLTVPPNVFLVHIEARGAQGGSASWGTGGMGAVLAGSFYVNPGDVLQILVGCQPTGGNNYAGGGGGTFVAKGEKLDTSVPLIVAGGGGGGFSYATGQGGQLTVIGGGPVPGNFGYGAPSTLCGGGGGGFYSSGNSDKNGQYGNGGNGFIQGGAAVSSQSGYQNGGFGGGAPPDAYGSCKMRAGAGGGYSGGSGLNTNTIQNYGYGGGSFNSGLLQSNSPNTNLGNGYVTVGWTPGVAVIDTRSSAPQTAFKTKSLAERLTVILTCFFVATSSYFFLL